MKILTIAVGAAAVSLFITAAFLKIVLDLPLFLLQVAKFVGILH